MKKLFTTTFTLLLSITLFAQKEKNKQQEITITYDSTVNFLGKNVMEYTGQELQLKGLKKSSQTFGYSGFILKYKKDDDLLNDKKNIYKPNDNYNSRYEDLAGKHFQVLEVVKHPKAKKNAEEYGDDFYLKLQVKENNDIIYYKYNVDSDFSFPFIVSGFITKQKSLQIGKEYVISDDVLKMARDINTGKALAFTTGQTWKCIDLIIDNTENELSLILQSSLKAQTSIPYSLLNNDGGIRKIYTASDAYDLTKKFNQNNFRRILQNKIRVGMTKDMTIMAWGEPSDKKEMGTGRNKTEQWFYPAGTLTFKGDKITIVK